ncbi:MAG: DUF6673 family protein [Christensenella sp.]
MITIRDKELNFNFMNADHVQKWEDSRKEVQKRYEDIAAADPSKMNLQEYADLLRRACSSIFDLFDGIFGDGTSNDLFGAECDFEVCIDAYGEFEQAIRTQAEGFGGRMDRFLPTGAKGKKK